MSIGEIIIEVLSDPWGIIIVLILPALCIIGIYLSIRKKVVLKLPITDLDVFFADIKKRYREKPPPRGYAIKLSLEKNTITFRKWQDVRLFGRPMGSEPIALRLYFRPKGEYTIVKYTPLITSTYVFRPNASLTGVWFALWTRKFLKREVLPLVKEVAGLVPKAASIPEVPTPTRTIHCPRCKTPFQIEVEKRAFRSRCPKCGLRISQKTLKDFRY